MKLEVFTFFTVFLSLVLCEIKLTKDQNKKIIDIETLQNEVCPNLAKKSHIKKTLKSRFFHKKFHSRFKSSLLKTSNKGEFNSGFATWMVHFVVGFVGITKPEGAAFEKCIDDAIEEKKRDLDNNFEREEYRKNLEEKDRVIKGRDFSRIDDIAILNAQCQEFLCATDADLEYMLTKNPGVMRMIIAYVSVIYDDMEERKDETEEETELRLSLQDYVSNLDEYEVNASSDIHSSYEDSFKTFFGMEGSLGYSRFLMESAEDSKEELSSQAISEHEQKTLQEAILEFDKLCHAAVSFQFKDTSVILKGKKKNFFVKLLEKLFSYALRNLKEFFSFLKVAFANSLECYAEAFDAASVDNKIVTLLSNGFDIVALFANFIPVVGQIISFLHAVKELMSYMNEYLEDYKFRVSRAAFGEKREFSAARSGETAGKLARIVFDLIPIPGLKKEKFKKVNKKQYFYKSKKKIVLKK